jgi:hypothetical protein
VVGRNVRLVLAGSDRGLLMAGARALRAAAVALPEKQEGKS